MIKNWSVVYKSLEQVVIGESSSKLIICKESYYIQHQIIFEREKKSTINLHFLFENMIIFNAFVSQDLYNFIQLRSIWFRKLKSFSHTRLSIWTWIWLTFIIRSIIEGISGGGWWTKWLQHCTELVWMAIDRLSYNGCYPSSPYTSGNEPQLVSCQHEKQNNTRKYVFLILDNMNLVSEQSSRNFVIFNN